MDGGLNVTVLDTSEELHDMDDHERCWCRPTEERLSDSGDRFWLHYYFYMGRSEGYEQGLQ